MKARDLGWDRRGSRSPTPDPRSRSRAVTAATSSGSALATSTTFPPPLPASVVGVAMIGHVVEEPARRRRLGAHEPERRIVDQVHHVHPARTQDALDLVEELGRREVPRDGQPAERVADDEVE